VEEVPQIIGQAAIAAAASNDLLDPAAGTAFVVSSLVLYNASAGTSVVSVYARKAGGTKNSDRQVAAISVPAGGTEPLKLGMTIGGDAGDILTVDAATNGITATAFGSLLTL